MNIGARDTVSIDESVHEIYKQLTEGSDPVTAPFKTMKDVFLWAACLGYKNGSRKKLAGKRVTIFRWAQFNQEVDIPTVKAIALAEMKEPGVLIDQEECLEILEEYANGAIPDLNLIIKKSGGQPLYLLVEELKLSVPS
jgi:dnd system-associated protein 4